MKQTGMLRRIISIALLLAMVLTAVPMALAENQHGYVVVNSGAADRTVNFRREANTNDNTNYPIARLPEYWVVEILGSQNVNGTSWYRVFTDANTSGAGAVDYQTGYVMAEYVHVMTADEEATYAARPTSLFNAVVVTDPSSEEDTMPEVSSGANLDFNVPGAAIDYIRVNVFGASLYDSVKGNVITVVLNSTTLPRYQVIPMGSQDAYEWSLVQYNGMMGYIREDCYEVFSSSSTVTSVPANLVTVAPNQYVNVTTVAPNVNPASAVVPGQTYGTVTADNVFFRKSMSTNGDFWARLPKGWSLQVLGVQQVGKITWYKVQGGTPENPTRTYTGFIHGNYFAVSGTLNVATPTPAPAQGADSNYGLVLVEGVNMRQTPGGTTMTVLRANTVVEIITKPVGATANDWFFIRSNGVAGYLPATAVRVLKTNELSQYALPDGVTPNSATAVPTAVRGYIKLVKDKVNVRKTPAGISLTATDQSKLPIGKVMAYVDGPVANSGYDWVLVTVNGITGYVRSDCYIYCDAQGNPMVTATPAPYQPGIVTAAPTVLPGGTQGYIKLIKGGVNFRATPGGSTQAQLAKDTVLPYFNIIKQNNASLETWYEVYSAQLGKFGYIMSTMATLCDAQGKPITPALPTGSPSSTIGYVATKVSSVWLRGTPYADGPTVGQVKNKGTVLPQIAPVVVNGYEWYPVQTAAGLQGYIRGDCVFALADWQIAEYQQTGKVPTPTPGPATPRPGNSSYIQTNTDKVFVRQSPSTKAATLGLLPLGTVLKFSTTQTIGRGTANQVTWYQVTYNGQIGWVHGNFARVLTNAEYDAMHATPSPVPGATAVPTTAPNLTNLSDLAMTTMDKVNIRANGYMTSKDIAMVDKAGTELTYLGKYTVPDPLKNNNYYWFNVRYGKVTGWIRGDCVRVLTVEEKAARRATAYPYYPTAAPQATYRTLYKNSTGDDVYALQYKLSQLGYLAADQVNGYYLGSTETAVIAFQRANGLTVDGIAGATTQHALFSTVTPGTTSPVNPGTPTYADGSSVTVTLYPVEMSDWFTGDIQTVWPNNSVAILTDVYTGISFKAQRLYGGNHADAEPVDTADTAAICAIYGVNKPQEIEDRESELQSYRRRPTWVTVGGRTFCASVYGIPHNYSGDRIPDNGYTGQFCVHFTNSRTHTSNIVDPDASYNNYFGAQSAIKYAYEHSISGTK